MRSRTVALVAFASFVACAPAWGSSAGASAVRHAALRHAADARPANPSAPVAPVLPATVREGPLAHVARPTTERTRRPKAHLSVSPASLTYLGGRVTFKWSSVHATRCTLAARPRFWAGKNPARVKCKGRITPVIAAADFPFRWKFTLKAKNAKGQVAVIRRTLVVHAPPFAVSPNWSGYVVPSATPVTAVSGQFTVPRLNCKHTTNAGEATWVGIGGAGGSSGDLLQTGVRSDCVGGAQYDNAAWWEEYPQYPEIDFQTMSVSPGDSMRASVLRNPDGSWTTRLDDLTRGISGVMTTGKGYGTVLDTSPDVWLHEEGTTAAVSYAGGHTAEWIVEAFEMSNGVLVRLADFHKIAFTGLTTSLPAWDLTTDEQVGIGDLGGYLYAAPSGPDSSNRGFSITYTG